MAVVIDLVTRFPVDIWTEENSSCADVFFETNILNLVKNKTLLLLDRGFYHFEFWQQLIEQQIDFIRFELFMDRFSQWNQITNMGNLVILFGINRLRRCSSRRIIFAI